MRAKRHHTFRQITDIGLAAATIIASTMLCLQSSAQSDASASTPRGKFAVASIRIDETGPLSPSFSPPGSLTFSARSVVLNGLIGIAYNVSDFQVSGLPEWAANTRYDVIAKPESDKPLNREQLAQALQQLLIQRFRLVVHRETKMMSGYKLVTAKGGPKLQGSTKSDESRVYLTSEGLRAPNTTLAQLAHSLEFEVGDFPVMDATGINGNFEIKLRYSREDKPNSDLPSVFTALQEQLGLNLIRAKVPVQMIVVDHVDRIPIPD